MKRLGENVSCQPPARYEKKEETHASPPHTQNVVSKEVVEVGDAGGSASVAQTEPSQAFPTTPPGRFPDHIIPDRFPYYFPDFVPDRFPDPFRPVPSHQEIV